jgi:uncharacterized membrane protein YkvA (DUF1232 family)
VSTDDPFPRDAFTALVRRTPAYGRLAWRLGRDPLLSRARRAAVVGAAAYLVSPVDAVPGFIPVLGQLDDILVVLAALRLALDGLDPERRRAHLAAVGLIETDIATDVRALGITGAWVGRSSVRAGGRAARTGARMTVRGVRSLGRAVGEAGHAVASRRRPPVGDA